MISWQLPIRTVSEANTHEHWTKKHKRSGIQKNLIRCGFMNCKQKITLPCEITLIRIAPRKLDDDNLQMAFKTIRDSLADLLIPGLAMGRADSDNRLEWHYKQEKGQPKQYEIKIIFKTKEIS